MQVPMYLLALHVHEPRFTTPKKFHIGITAFYDIDPNSFLLTIAFQLYFSTKKCIRENTNQRFSQKSSKSYKVFLWQNHGNSVFAFWIIKA